MAAFTPERVLEVRHWNDTLFSFKTTRPTGLRFENGQFVMLGLMIGGRPLLRAYSIASANHEEHLEFLSIKVENGALTSRLQHLEAGGEVLIGSKPTGTLVLRDLRPGRHLYMFATGTGLAPFIGLVKDPEVYENHDKVVLVHGVRRVSDLAYHGFFTETLPRDEVFGGWVRDKFVYHPTVTREPFRHQGRVTELVASDKLFDSIGLPPLDPQTDRCMICGSPSMLADLCALLDARAMQVSPRSGEQGDYVFERAFVEK